MSSLDLQISLPSALQSTVTTTAAAWQSGDKLGRLWAKDASLWTSATGSDDESIWLGWLDIVERQQADLASFAALREDIRSTGFTHALLLGMGGSSLCPEVLSLTYGQQPGFPKLHIVDSTDPAQVAAARAAVDLKKTICIVSSKSGSTLEPNILKDYFFSEMAKEVGAGNAGKHFIAVTDPGSKMEAVAKADGFRHIFYGDKTIGGRFSALSNFGIVPAAVAGLDVPRFLAEAKRGVDVAHKTDIATNAGALLGIVLGDAHNAGMDKLTFFTSKEIFDLGAWLEQLIAESTGKTGKGITPVDREPVGPPSVYGKDRVFAYIRLSTSDNAAQDAAVEALAAAGHPVVQFTIDDVYELPGIMFLWEIAVSVAGSVMGINTFNQPDVEAAKIETRKLTDEYNETGKLAEHEAILDVDGIKLYADETYGLTLSTTASAKTLTEYLKAHLAQIKPNDYFATLAYLKMTDEHEKLIQTFRMLVRDRETVATCLGFGPRFLHSTGQDYKGGPNTGVFLQITADHATDVAIPNARYTFGVVIDAQAAGDLAVLQQRGRRALRVHLGADVTKGLNTLGLAMAEALA
ncbi:glucose-6-phosphate isomerase [Terriglobus roseus DSM 18391]|uniref:Glucose-6-phosphate isomerase n=1 Tax=Terriglobus roseus (strain DSM 18391 / NRRL B-41598 / KBS 63) TaxID=926566 RepID=I3ZF80_TERRK|nr:bifunctional transaldolase/phosoglucose isomerase [Terriglobus roseus]AFL87898.1 glucose-6-phosphate isomerase [Terriglobus roseus DSM 18391]